MVQFYLKPCTPLPFQVDPLGFAIFFFMGGLFPTTGYAERDNSPLPSSWSTTTYFLLHLFDSYKRKMTCFNNFYECFPELIESFFPEKMKTKKKNSLKRASLTEHFIGRLDQISLSLYVSKALYSFSYKNYLKLSWRNFSVLAFQKNKIHSSTHHAHIHFKF